jgi:aryl-alcohol dehydrogenase-like predicted oxidoreductase
MEYRQLGRSGLRVSALTLGTMTFGGRDKFSKVGATDVDGARRHIDMALDAGVNLIDTANVYSSGASEEIVGQALGGRRDRVLVATKARFAMGSAPNDAGLSRHHLIEACEASLRRLQTDHVDLYQVHEWDGQTPLEETLGALDHLLQSGKVRYVGCSNFAGWQVMKALGVAARTGLPSFVSQQVYLSLQERSAEYEIVPSALDQGLGCSSGARSPADCYPESTGVGNPRRRALVTRANGTSRRSTMRTSSTTRSRRSSRSPTVAAAHRPRSRSPGYLHDPV